jgi:hypothetical protein
MASNVALESMQMFIPLGIIVTIAGIIFMLVHSVLDTSGYDADITSRTHARREIYNNPESINREIDRIISDRHDRKKSTGLLKKLTENKEPEKPEWVIKKL